MDIQPSEKQKVKEFLQTIKVRDALCFGRPIVTVDDTDTVLVALKQMMDHKLLGLPVFDTKRKRYCSFIDIQDILGYALKVMNEAELKECQREGTNEFISLMERHKVFSEATCGQVANTSQRDIFIQVLDIANLETAISVICDLGDLHRVIVVNQKDELVGILSQLQLVSFLSQHVQRFGFQGKTIADLRFGYTPLVTVRSHEKVREALIRLQNHKLSAIPVLDENGNLFEHFSSSDFKVIGYDGSLMARICMTVSEFLKLLREKNPKKTALYFVSPTLQIDEIPKKFHENRIHQMYIVDDEKKPLGVISLIDFITLLFKSYVR
jgi:CBS-domain-containing membrane protein